MRYISTIAQQMLILKNKQRGIRRENGLCSLRTREFDGEELFENVSPRTPFQKLLNKDEVGVIQLQIDEGERWWKKQRRVPENAGTPDEKSHA